MASLSALRLGSALALVALAAGCAATPAPAAPDETPESPASLPESTPESTAAQSAPPETAAPTESAPSEPAAAASGTGPQDTRGKAEIQQVMAANREKVRACYEAALPQNPGAKGDLVIDFTIDPRGEVKQAEVNWSASDLHIPELDTCAVDAVRSIKFPASSRGLESKVSYPFNFNPPRPGKPAAREEPAGPSR
jgi:TonB family protein